MPKVVASDKKKPAAVKSKYSAPSYANLTSLHFNGRKDNKGTADQEAQKLSPEQAKAYQELLRLEVFN
ncbi:MAG: hypothetical protein AB1815_10455 [Bacillota bacterium]